MNKTIRLFDISSKAAAFDATVIFCGELDGGNFEVVLDRTAFFPEEGGQSCDGGTLGGAVVLSVDATKNTVTFSEIRVQTKWLDDQATHIERIE